MLRTACWYPAFFAGFGVQVHIASHFRSTIEALSEHVHIAIVHDIMFKASWYQSFLATYVDFFLSNWRSICL